MIHIVTLCSQHVNVTLDRGVAISGNQMIFAVTFTCKVIVWRMGALVLWRLIPTLTVVSS